jgi:hypothetical protein
VPARSFWSSHCDTFSEEDLSFTVHTDNLRVVTNIDFYKSLITD